MLIGRSGRDNGVASQGCRAATFTLSADSPRKFAWSLVEVVGSQREKGRRDASRRWVQQQRRHRGREGERRPRDLRALLASNSKRARATCLEYSLVIFPSGHPPVSLFSLPFPSLLFSSLLFSSFLISFLLSSLLSAWRLSDILFAKRLPAGCHCFFLSYARRNVSLLARRFHAIKRWQHQKEE